MQDPDAVKRLRKKMLHDLTLEMLSAPLQRIRALRPDEVTPAVVIAVGALALLMNRYLVDGHASCVGIVSKISQSLAALSGDHEADKASSRSDGVGYSTAIVIFQLVDLIRASSATDADGSQTLLDDYKAHLASNRLQLKDMGFKAARHDLNDSSDPRRYPQPDRGDARPPRDDSRFRYDRFDRERDERHPQERTNNFDRFSPVRHQRPTPAHHSSSDHRDTGLIITRLRGMASVRDTLAKGDIRCVCCAYLNTATTLALARDGHALSSCANKTDAVRQFLASDAAASLRR